jgi:nitrogen fixation protein FixH
MNQFLSVETKLIKVNMKNKNLSGKKVFMWFAVFFGIIILMNVFMVYKAIETKPENIETTK